MGCRSNRRTEKRGESFAGLDVRLLRCVSLFVVAGLVTTCASGPRGERTLRCEGCGFAAALAQVIGAFADIDAQLAEARADEAAGGAELLGVIDWRRPEADSAVLVVRLAADAAGTTVTYSAMPVARLLEARAAPTPVPGAPGPPLEVCQPCRSWQLSIEPGPGDNLRALVNQREATRRLGEALARRLGGPTTPPSSSSANPPGRSVSP